jgi:hypothetical protein
VQVKIVLMDQDAVKSERLNHAALLNVGLVSEVENEIKIRYKFAGECSKSVHAQAGAGT